MIHLELAAIHLQKLLGVAVQHVGESFHSLRFSRSRRTEQQEDARRPALWRQQRPVHQNVGYDGGDRCRLAH
jgi:hypothetical protein